MIDHAGKEFRLMRLKLGFTWSPWVIMEGRESARPWVLTSATSSRRYRTFRQRFLSKHSGFHCLYKSHYLTMQFSAAEVYIEFTFMECHLKGWCIFHSLMGVQALILLFVFLNFLVFSGFFVHIVVILTAISSALDSSTTGLSRNSSTIFIQYAHQRGLISASNPRHILYLSFRAGLSSYPERGKRSFKSPNQCGRGLSGSNS